MIFYWRASRQDLFRLCAIFLVVAWFDCAVDLEAFTDFFVGYAGWEIAIDCGYGGGKADSVVLHNEPYGITSCAASLAVTEILIDHHVEAGRFFVVEWAEADVILASLLDLHPRLNHGKNVVIGAVDIGLGDFVGHSIQRHFFAEKKINPDFFCICSHLSAAL